jgi:hypothetical protein
MGRKQVRVPPDPRHSERTMPLQTQALRSRELTMSLYAISRKAYEHMRLFISISTR